MRTWLLEGGLSALLFLALLPAASAPLIGAVYRRFGYPATAPTALSLLTGLYACALLSFTTFPLPADPAARCARTVGVDYWQLQPGASLGDMADAFGSRGVAALTSGVVLQVFFNVVFFIPLGMLVAYWWRRGPGTALILGLGTSLLIEVGQGTALWGLYPCPYRLADVDDLVTNTAGALVGWVLGAGLSRLWPYRTPKRRPDPGPPSLRRRLVAAAIDIAAVVVVQGLVGVAAVALARGLGQTLSPAELRAIAAASGAGVVGLVPLVRRDGATPGQMAVLLVTVSASGAPAGRGTLLVRFAVRWLGPLMVGAPLLLAVLVLEGVGTFTGGDRSSTTSKLLRLKVQTRQEWADRGPHPSAVGHEGIAPETSAPHGAG